MNTLVFILSDNIDTLALKISFYTVMAFVIMERKEALKSIRRSLR